MHPVASESLTQLALPNIYIHKHTCSYTRHTVIWNLYNSIEKADVQQHVFLDVNTEVFKFLTKLEANFSKISNSLFLI